MELVAQAEKYRTVTCHALKRASASGRGGVVTSSEFLDLAGRAAIDQSPSRLIKEASCAA
jgi:hypothetical protein